MGENPSRNRQPAIREISVDEGGSPRTLDAPTPPTGPGWWIAGLVAIAAVAGLGYGFLLGRGDRPDGPETSDSAVITTTIRATTTTIADQFPVSSVTFVRATPGHDLGAGVTEYLNPNLYDTVDVDADGIIWAGGASGVVRLDPATERFTALTWTDGRGPLDITAIAAAPDGTVWAASSRGLSHWDGTGWSHDSRFPLAYPNELWIAGLEAGPEGEVWAATNSWGEFDTEGTAQIHRLEEPYAGDMWTTTMTPEIGAVRLGDDGALWALVGNRLWRYNGGWSEAANLGARQFGSMTIDGSGAVWLGGDRRIARWDGQELSEVPWKTEEQQGDDANPLGPGVWIQALASGVGDDVWALTHSYHSWDSVAETPASELLHFDSGTLTRTPLPDGSDVGNPRSFVVSPTGDVWVAAETSLLRFDGEWQAFSMDNQLPLVSPSSLAVDSTGELWTADDDRILQKDGEAWRQFELSDFGLEPDGTRLGEFWVTSAPDGRIWGGVGCRAYQRIGREWQSLPQVPDRPDECWNVRATVDLDDSLWMSPGCCSIRSPVYRWSGEEWEEMTTTGEIHDFAFGDDGEIWLVDSGGIKHFTDGVWATVLSGVSVNEIAISGDGEVSAAGGAWSAEGLWNYDGDTWTLTRPGEAIHSLARGPSGEVWALETRPDGRTDLVELATGRRRLVTDSPTSGEMAIADDGTVWIGGEGRLYRVDPQG